MGKPIAIGIIGMGGFAGDHHDAIVPLEDEGIYHLICACDPAMESFTPRQEALRFAERGIRTFTDFRAMLAACRDQLDVVTIPTPIPYHAPMHRACVEDGLAVYLEKPPTLDYAELEQMITVDAGARFQTVVGFNFIVEAERQALKRRLVSGEFGAVRRVVISELAPRNSAYYGRAAWAGRLLLDGRMVLDSCIGNSMAHSVHNGLFWCGIDHVWNWGTLTSLTAELYRGHQIEGVDTAFVRAATAQGVELLVTASHACHGWHHKERVECELAQITYHIYNSGPNGALFTVLWNDGREETLGTGKLDTLAANLRTYADYLNGKYERPLTTLADCRPFVQLIDLAYIAARTITTVRGNDLQYFDNGFLEIQGLPEAAERFIATGDFPSQQQYPWAAPGGLACPDDLPQLSATISAMSAAAGNYFSADIV